MSLTTLVYKGIKFDSDEEVFFAAWLEELKLAGFVTSWKKQKLPIYLTKGLKIPYTKRIELKTKTKFEEKEKILLKPSEYTMDFIIDFSWEGHKKFVSAIEISKNFKPNALFFTNRELNADEPVYVEVKPSFDQNNMERLFRNNQKFIWAKFKVFINLIEPLELFKKTFMPTAIAPYFKYKKPPKGKKVGDWKMDWLPKTLKEFLCK